ncbi:MAG: S41 family peptidase [Thermoanaerobacteraceae bacterium]|nr:S41 family peptidase [Thermoanaerobacteraceae bacterium]
MRNKNFIKDIALVLVGFAVAVALISFVPVPLPGGSIVLSGKQYDDFMEFRKLMEIKSILTQRYLTDVDPKTLYDGAFKGMAASLNDPYTVYMTQKEYNDFMTETTGNYAGIGLVVSADDEGNIRVVSPIKGSPAETVGIKANDIIIAVDDKPVSGKDLDAAVAMMKGQAGTMVKVTITREGVDQPLNFNIKRDVIKLETVSYEKLSNDIGYIRLTMFDEHTDEDFKNAVKDLKAQDVKGIIIDLRDNPGGLLDVCVNIADEILPKGTIVYTEDRNGKREYSYSDGRALGLPLVVLVNGGSASASEILSGAIRDNGAGTLVGTKTFGKGLVQTMYKFEDGSGLKYTIAKYYTPKGTDIQGKGILPDIVVELPEDVAQMVTVPKDKDTQLKKAIEVLEQKINSR